MIGAIAIGLLGGAVAGLMGLGGGVLFVPGLVIFLGLNQQQAEATSLLAIVPVAAVGAFRHDRQGNVRRRDGLTVGITSLFGATLGVVLANAVSGAALRIAFALLLLVVATQLARHGLRPGPTPDAREDRPPDGHDGRSHGVPGAPPGRAHR